MTLYSNWWRLTTSPNAWLVQSFSTESMLHVQQLLLFLILLPMCVIRPTFASQCPNLLSASHAQFVGQIQYRNGNNMEMETLSLYPPIWRIKNFLTSSESESFVQQVLNDREGKTTASSIKMDHLDRKSYNQTWGQVVQNNSREELDTDDLNFFMASDGFNVLHVSQQSIFFLVLVCLFCLFVLTQD